MGGVAVNDGPTGQSRSTRLVRALADTVGSNSERLIDAAVLTGCNVLVAAISFFAVLCIARVMGKARFGEYAYAVVLGQYAYILVIFSGDRTLVRDLVQYTSRRYAILSAGFSVRLCLLAATAVAAITFTLLPGSASLSAGQVLVVLGTALGGLTLEGVFDYWGQFRRHGVYNVIGKSLFALLVCLPLLLPAFGMSMLWVGSATAASAFVFLGLQARYVAGRLPWMTMRFSRRDVATAVRGNWALWISAFGGVFYIGLNRIVLRNVWGSEELGNYAASAKLIDMAVLCLLQVSRLGRPRMAAVVGDGVASEHRRAFVARYLAALLGLSLVFAVPAFLFPKLILTTLFGAAYADGAGALRVLSVYLVVHAAGIVAAQYVISRRNDRLYFVFVLLGCVLASIACSFLIPRWGATGAAWALLMSHGVAMALYCTAMFLSLGRSSRD